MQNAWKGSGCNKRKVLDVGHHVGHETLKFTQVAIQKKREKDAWGEERNERDFICIRRREIPEGGCNALEVY